MRMNRRLLDAVDGRKVLYELVNTPPLAAARQRPHPLRLLRPRPDRSARAAPDQGAAEDRRRKVRVTLRWLITGAGGMVGTDLRTRWSRATRRRRADEGAISTSPMRPRFAMPFAARSRTSSSTARRTRKSIDAETNEHLANAINGSAVELLADAANDVDALLVQISTDFVFDGCERTPYEVNDADGAALRVRPLEAPRRARRERARGSTSSSRTSWLFGMHGPNFVEAIRNQIRKGTNPLRVVDDQRGRPTYTPHLAEAIIRLAQRATTTTRAASSTTPTSRSARGSTSRARSSRRRGRR